MIFMDGGNSLKVEYINPFLEASNLVISQTTGIMPELGPLSVLAPPIKGEEVTIYVGVTGEIKGFAAFSLTTDASCKVASRMMGGMPVDHFDELVKSAIGEMANMICGNTTVKFSELGYSMNIAPPAVMTGKDITVSSTIQKILNIPLKLKDVGVINIQVALELQKPA